MTEETREARFALLRENGFEAPPICDLMSVFCGPHLALDTRMSVRGDHADERAYMYYASMEVDGELLDGLFYVPSLLEHLYFLGREKGWSFDALRQELNDTVCSDARLVFLSGYPAIFTEIYTSSWQERDLRFEISDMLKVVGALDYLLSKELERMRAEEQ
jgi:hypothetical protein